MISNCAVRDSDEVTCAPRYLYDVTELIGTELMLQVSVDMACLREKNSDMHFVM